MNELVQRKCGTINFLFTNNSNIYSKMLRSSELHLNNRGTTRLANNFCYILSK